MTSRGLIVSVIVAAMLLCGGVAAFCILDVNPFKSDGSENLKQSDSTSVAIDSTGVADEIAEAPQEEQIRDERLSGEFNLLKSVPSDAVGIVCFDHLSEALKDYFDSTFVFNQFKLKHLGNARVVVSFHYSGDIVPLLSIDNHRGAEPELPEGFHMERIGHYLLISPSENLVSAGRRCLHENASILDATGFADALSSVSDDMDGVVVFPNQAAAKLLPRKFLSSHIDRKELVSFIRSSAEWTVMKSSGKGFVVHEVNGATTASYLNALGSLRPGKECRLAFNLPESTSFAVDLPLFSVESFIETNERYLDASLKMDAYESSRALLKKSCGKDPLQWAKEMNLKEVAVLKWNGGEVLLARPAKNKIGSDITENPCPGFIPAVFGNIFSIGDDSCMAADGPWIVFGDAASVQAYRDCDKWMDSFWPSKGVTAAFYADGYSLVWDRKGIRFDLY